MAETTGRGIVVVFDISLAATAACKGVIVGELKELDTAAATGKAAIAGVVVLAATAT